MKVAVVGSGVSGLGAAWLLNEHSEHEVHLFESDFRPGGHANTVIYAPPGRPESEAIPVDTGFIVLNPTTYPNFLKFLKHKNISITPTDMTFSVSRDKGAFEWAGSGLSAVFCQPWRVLDPDMWLLIYDVLRFNACAGRILLDKRAGCSMTIGKYLDVHGYSASFRDNYLIPMTAAVWSTSPDKCTLGFPAKTLIQFLHNHHLLQLIGKPSWLTINNGSKVYVEKIVSGLGDRLHLSTPITSVETSADNKVHLKALDGSTHSFDHVILACHSDAALDILRKGNITPNEDRILSRFGWSKNEAVLHCDTQLMPKSRLAWSCWNYLSFSTVDGTGKPKANIDRVALTYSMNLLQHISEEKHGPVLVTLNPPFEPREETITGRWAYDHPILNTEAILAQSEMSSIQNKRGISFAGAYLRYGFHEDGFTSGLRAAVKHLHAKPPFDVHFHAERPLSNGDLVFNWVIPTFFDILELSGVRLVIGFFFSTFLQLLALFLGMFFDLSQF